MNAEQLGQLAKRKNSLLCVGLDPMLKQLPADLPANAEGVFTFCRDIVQATAPYAIAYKLNIAFFEVLGSAGWHVLEKLLPLMPADALLIADAKRGDIGSSSALYAQTFFETYNFGAVTVSPYMGSDSVEPFLAYAGKTTFVLALTSNPGANDFQLADEEVPLYRSVVLSAQKWKCKGELGFVVGATRPAYVADVRAHAPHQWLLVPGVGAQGGDLDAVCKAGITPQGGLLINASRSIIYAASDTHFAQAAAKAAQALALQTGRYLAGA
jgi:orotidine-5'-phosphate decarboxylase